MIWLKNCSIGVKHTHSLKQKLHHTCKETICFITTCTIISTNYQIKCPQCVSGINLIRYAHISKIAKQKQKYVKQIGSKKTLNTITNICQNHLWLSEDNLFIILLHYVGTASCNNKYI